MTKNTKKQFSLVLKNSGYKATKPRLLVLEFLFASKKPVDAKEIIKKLKKDIDPVTIYRTLQTLQAENIITKIDLKEDRAYFEMADTKKDHHHIVCLQCKKVKDFTGCQFKKLANKVLKNMPDFAAVTNHSFELFGMCKACAK